MDYFRILAIAWGIVMLVLLFWNGWVGWNLGRDDKKVQTTEVDVEEIQEKYEYTRQEAYTYTKYYNMLNAQNLEKCNENNKYLSRIKQLPEGDEIQNRILMNLPALWDEFIRPATEEEISEFFEENPKLTGATNLWT